MHYKRILLSICLYLTLISCSETTSSGDKLFTLMDKSATGIDFINKVEETQEFNAITYRNFYNGGGVAIGDINNDQLPDIYFTANQSENKLYLNKGNFKFEDITSTAGVGGTRAWSTGVSMADVNGDGFLDIYVCNSGDIAGENKENELFMNNGDGTFTEKAKEYNLNNEGYTTHAAFFDYDADGDLDCYILNNSFKDPSRIELYRSMRNQPDLLGGDRLMRNDGNSFTDVSNQAGIYSSEIGFGLGVAVGDLNNDNKPDIYISNDFWERDYLYLNNGDGTFKEDLINRIDYTSVSSMGADIADINGDGNPDIFTTDMLSADSYRIQSMVNFDPYHLEDLKYRANYHYQNIQNCLQINDGNANFQEMAFMADVAATDWSWGALFFDFDNDGKRDLYVANGIYKDLMSGDFRDFMNSKNLAGKSKPEIDFMSLTSQMPSNALKNFAYINKGNLVFKNLADSLGFGTPSFSNGASYADLDNDGDLDLVINNTNMPSFVYKNNTEKLVTNNYLKIKFKGPEKNPFGIGAKVKVQTSNGVQVYENFTNRGFESSVEPIQTIGLGTLAKIISIDVFWPDGSFDHLENIQSNQTIEIAYYKTEPFKNTNTEINSLLVNITQDAIKGNITHHENPYNDFNQELLLHRMLSTESPRLIVGDCNGDQKKDFIMLGARGEADKLYIQNYAGQFVQKTTPVFLNDFNFESTCGAFIDADMDGDDDLLIGSGGNQTDVEQINFIVRLYINDGTGNFSVDPNKIPPSLGNYSTLEVCDFDYDGDKDVFLGARVVPGNYGLIPKSTLLRNDRDSWVDITSEPIAGMGMVSDATFSDIDNDGYEDLLVVGDWMSILVFKNEKGKFNTPTTIPNSTGWWTRIEASDLNGDGFMDFVLGNWGNNTKFQASRKMPLTMYVKDFDANGKSEFIINWKAPMDSVLFPFATKMEITQQMPELKRKNLKYDQFARLTYDQLFDVSKRENAQKFIAENLSSSILWNKAGALSLKELPKATQSAPIFGIVCEDFDKDGIKDIWCAGNYYDVKPQVGRHNANKGVMLKGSKSGNFSIFSSSTDGLKGQIRDARFIDNKIVVARNNDRILVYKIK